MSDVTISDHQYYDEMSLAKSKRDDWIQSDFHRRCNVRELVTHQLVWKSVYMTLQSVANK